MPKIKSAAQTPAPKSDRIYGSKTNPKGSASSRKSAKSIVLSEKIVDSLKKKLQEFKKSHKKDITLNDLKAVYRRGLGAYSSSHRPTITGGAPNTRNAWAMARVNKFLLKAGGTKVKAAYVQDDDLMQDGGNIEEVVCVNCGWGWRFEDSEEFDKYVCHRCDFDNRVFYDSDPVGEVSAKLKKPKTLSEIAKIHCVSEESLKPALQKGIETEKEHTTDDVTAGTIALHHLAEMLDYYDKLQEMEHSDQPESKYCIWEKKFSTEMAEGGEIEEVGVENYLQTQKEDAETVLFSNKSQLVKNMICNAHIELAEQKIGETESALEKNIWNEVKNIWQETKEEIVDVTFMYEEGGATQKCGCGCGVSSFSRGGLAYGNSHDKGGMPMKVKDTGQDIEIEGGEGVINKRSMQMTKKVEFQGKQMTPCEVISKINQMGGGVKFNCPDVKEIIEKDGDY